MSKVESTRSIAGLLAEAKDHHAARRLREAAESYALVIAAAPRHVEAWRSLGVIAFGRGEPELARTLVTRAVLLDARDAASYRVLATLDELDGRLELAYGGYAKSCGIDPAQPAATVALARVALALGHPAETIAVAEAALARGIGGDAELFRLLGTARALQRNYRGAKDALEASLRLQPDADTLARLAGANLRLNLIEAALDACRAALALDPLHAVALLHQGIARYAQGALTEALALFERALALGCEEAHVNLGRLKLLLGDDRQGFVHFGHDDAVRRALPIFAALPMWDGTVAPDTRLLVWHEQGVGDTIQLARFLRAARDRVGTLTLAVPPEAAELFGAVDGVDAVVDMHRTNRFAAFDRWLPTIRLPELFKVTRQSLAPQPYLRADPRRIERFRARLAVPGCLRVGLVWSGNPLYARDAARSCGLAALEPLDGIGGIAWFALQQGERKHDVPQSVMRLVPINAEVSNYADTAAIIAQLDLVITVDTSVANLTGALGRPGWVLLPEIPDWRWGREGDVSPWYPTLRLFRQHGNGGWAPVVDAMKAELRTLADRSGAGEG